MKFLYPIKKLNIKSWIKYWLLKKGLNPIVLSDLIEGTTPITIEKAYEGTTLQELAFKGQTVSGQLVKGNNTITINDTDYQVNLKSKNLFDKTTIVAGDIKGSASSIRLSSRQALWLDVGTYTMSTNAVSPFRYSVSVQNVGVPPLGVYPTYILDSGWKTGNISYTFTLTTAGYFVLALSKTSGNITVDEVADFEYQLEQASEPTAYEPYYNYELGENDKIWNNNGTWQINDSEITDTTLILQLEAIKNASLIPGTNEITQRASDLPFILNFKYYMKG